MELLFFEQHYFCGRKSKINPRDEFLLHSHFVKPETFHSVIHDCITSVNFKMFQHREEIELQMHLE